MSVVILILMSIDSLWPVVIGLIASPLAYLAQGILSWEYGATLAVYALMTAIVAAAVFAIANLGSLRKKTHPT